MSAPLAPRCMSVPDHPCTCDENCRLRCDFQALFDKADKFCVGGLNVTYDVDEDIGYVFSSNEPVCNDGQKDAAADCIRGLWDEVWALHDQTAPTSAEKCSSTYFLHEWSQYVFSQYCECFGYDLQDD